MNLSLILTNTLLPWALIFLSVLFLKKYPDYFLHIFLIDVWLLSHPHAVSTFLKENVFQKISKSSLLIIFISLVICLISITYYWGTVVAFNIYFFAQWFHYMRQNYGISIKEYRIKNSWDLYFQKTILHLVPILALLNLGSKGSIGLFGYYIFFPFNLDFNIEPIYFVVLGLWTINELYNANSFNLKYFIYSSSTLLLYYFAYFYLDNFIFGWLGLTIYHNIQYLIYNWIDDKKMNKSLNFRKFYGWAFVISILVFGIIELGEYAIFYYAVPFTLVCTLSVNFTHYIFDSLIWRRA